MTVKFGEQGRFQIIVSDIEQGEHLFGFPMLNIGEFTLSAGLNQPITTFIGGLRRFRESYALVENFDFGDLSSRETEEALDRLMERFQDWDAPPVYEHALLSFGLGEAFDGADIFVLPDKEDNEQLVFLYRSRVPWNFVPATRLSIERTEFEGALQHLDYWYEGFLAKG